jgi:CheY-like chemotaxis protein
MIELAAGSQIAVRIRTDPLAGRVRADAAQLEQAILNLVVHACSAMPEGGRLNVETGTRDVPSQGSVRSHAALSVVYDDVDADPARTLDPGGASDSGLAVPMAQAIVAEHGGYFMASSSEGRTSLEILLPHIQEDQPAVEPVKNILMVDCRARVRAALHNFFEAHGYNLIEAASSGEALALGQMHEGAIDVLIAPAADVDAILTELREVHPGLDALRIVNHVATACGEIRQPFTQQALLDRVRLLEPPTSSAGYQPSGSRTTRHPDPG